MEWMLLPLKRYADFKGRSRRKEYWMFLLGTLIAMLTVGLIGGALGAIIGGDPSGVAMLFAGLLWLGLIIPALAVKIRRFHDLDRSGWFIFVGAIPLIGGPILLVFLCLPGTRGANRYGPDPLEASEDKSSVFV